MAIRISRSISCFLLSFRLAFLYALHIRRVCVRVGGSTLSDSLSAILINFYYFYKPRQQGGLPPAQAASSCRVGRSSAAFGFVSSTGIYLAKGSTGKKQKWFALGGLPDVCLELCWRCRCRCAVLLTNAQKARGGGVANGGGRGVRGRHCEGPNVFTL